jgi:predicted outer membrane repeat protein
LLALSGSVFAVTYYVHPDGVTGTIQDAIDILDSGDTIIAKPGTYKGPGNRGIDFEGKAITLRSEGGAEATIIDCEWGDPAFSFHSGEGSNTVVDGFTMTRAPGCIVCSGSSPTIVNCILTGNVGGQGGGIYCNQGSPTIVSCLIHDNVATEGGGIFCVNYSDPVIVLCTIYTNLADYGAGIYCWGYSDPIIAGCWITLNTAGDDGGGLGFYEHSGPTIASCWITDNSSGRGGGISCGSPSGTINDTWIAGNRATAGHGGGVYTGDFLTLNNCTISGNSASVHGGGISAYMASVELNDSIVCGNKAVSDGGGIHLGGSNYAWIINSKITGNAAGGNAGGIYASSSPWISKSIIAGNKSAGDGGGIFLYEAVSGTKPVADCTIACNKTEEDGGGIYCTGTIIPITNCTIADNEASYDGGGVFTDNFSYPTLTNCILWGDSPNEVSGSFSNPTLNYCDIQGGWTGDGANNMYAYPQFVGWDGGTWTSNGAYDPGSWYVTFTDTNANWIVNALAGRLINPDTSQPLSFVVVENTDTTITAYVDWQTMDAGASWVLAGSSYAIHDYRLSATLPPMLQGAIPSPCIDAGDNSAPGMSTLDCDSNHRIWDVGTGWTVDIGAYECGSVPFAVTQMRMNESGYIELTWNSSGVRGTTYDLWYSDDDFSESMTWNLLQADIPTQGASTTYTDVSALPGSQRYYRISAAE